MEEKQITEFNVGEKFELFGGDQHIGKEGCYLEALEDNAGYLLSIYLNNMSAREKNELRNSIFRARYIKENNKVLILIRLGNSPLIFDVAFDPTLYKDNKALQLTLNNHMILFVGIESTTNIIQTLRYANFPQLLKPILITAWNKAFEEENYSENYTKWVNKMYQYDSYQLWEMGNEVGSFGEDYKY